MKINQKEKGFTIIEVVLVLAIAALIFLMVFIALPALEISQRDTARKSDVGVASSGVESFVSNNQGKFPGAGTGDIQSYVKNVSTNTSTVTVTDISRGFPTSVSPTSGTIEITPTAQCGTSSTGSETLTQGITNQYTVVTKLESGGGAYYCLND
ncbi:MAG TPA: type II secretion system protein [Candidatus Saccharimonadales bacterium]|nr:type II secretion system protein [Candidatus Saccharimonadales bacterium]